MKDVKTLSLGNLIGELMNTSQKISSLDKNIENDYAVNLKCYYTAIMKELDKREEKYDSYKHPPVFK